MINLELIRDFNGAVERVILVDGSARGFIPFSAIDPQDNHSVDWSRVPASARSKIEKMWNEITPSLDLDPVSATYDFRPRPDLAPPPDPIPINFDGFGEEMAHNQKFRVFIKQDASAFALVLGSLLMRKLPNIIENWNALIDSVNIKPNSQDRAEWQAIADANNVPVTIQSNGYLVAS